MNYRRYRFQCEPLKPTAEILVSELADLGFESFVDTPTGVEAYIPESQDDPRRVENLVQGWDGDVEIAFTAETIPDENWNARWESEYEPVRVGNRFFVRASFHPVNPEVEHDIVIDPRMSFGTGHHATTALMLEMIGDMDLHGKSVLDMGCGTGVLGIAAMLSGASSALGIDTEERAYENSLENAAANGVDMRVKHGNAAEIGGRTFDVIFANINKNVLKADMATYAHALKPGGTILLSGFFDTDIGELTDVAGKYNLRPTVTKESNHWAALAFQKAIS